MNWQKTLGLLWLATGMAGAAPAATGPTAAEIEDPAYWKPRQMALARLGDGYLVWESRRTGTWQIWAQNLDATGLHQLTPVEKDRDQKCPQISPDGTKIAYVSFALDDKGPAPLHLINRDGTGDHIIAPAARRYGVDAWDRTVVWFNDTELAYISGDGNTYRLNLATGQRVLLFKQQHGDMWLPNTKMDHVVASFNQVSRLNPEKQTVTALPSLGGCQPYPTSDGNWVTWNHVCGGPIARANLVTGAVTDYAIPMPDGYGFIYFSMVSDNMSLMALAGVKAEHKVGGYCGGDESWYEIFVVPLDPKTLDLNGKPVRYTFGSTTTNRFPDVWQATPAFGFLGDKAPFAVAFSSKDMTGDWAWDYGDGTTETAVAGKHLYAKPGVYVVSATQGNRVLRGQVTVKDPTPPKALGAIVENIKEIVVSFNEPMNLNKASFTMASGAKIARWDAGEANRSARLVLAERLTKDDTILIAGATDQAQKSNALVSANLPVKASFWPDNPARLAFVWETGNKPNLVRDPFSGEIHSFTTEWRNRSWMDHDRAMVCAGGMCNIMGIREVWFNDIRQSDHPGQVSFECTLTPRNLTAAHQVVSTLGLVQKKDHLFFESFDLGVVEVGKAYHVLIASGNGELRGYLNGKEVLNTKKNWAFEGSLTFGSGLYNLPWYGTIEGIALYNRILTATEAKADYDAYQKLLAARKPVPTVEVEAELVEPSKVSTPAQIAPYLKGLAYYDYKVRKVLSGKLDAPKVRVAHWSVLDRDPTRTSTLPVGAVMRLTLEPMEGNPQLEGEQTDDTLPFDDTPHFFAIAEARVGATGVPAWKLLPADMAKAEPLETMPDIATSFKPAAGQVWKIGVQDPFDGMMQPGWLGYTGTVYALAYVTSPREQTCMLSLYSAATAIVWLNGQSVTTLAAADIARYPFTGNKRVSMKLKAGENQLLVKVTNESGNFAFACDLVGPQGQELTDVTYAVEPK